MIDEELIKKINELAAISKVRELTEEEKEKQQAYRKQYLIEFRKQWYKTYGDPSDYKKNLS